MKYLYVDQSQDKVVLVSKKHNSDVISDTCVEYVVPEDFDLTKEMTDDEGNTAHLEGFLTATEFLARYNADYVAQRRSAYPPMEDYLDAIVKNDTAAIEKYKSDCLAVKAAYPKGE